jgi:hypothetical protein
MNDNLRELVFEAHRQCEKKTYGWQRNPEEFRQKFAEVIIRECAEIALRENHDPYECILKHFGLDTTETVDETLRRRSTYYGNNP